ncbi:MAG: hypothetical protein ABI867_11730 [Kofleriaceae bacterium]
MGARRDRRDIWIACTGLLAALVALPLAPSSWHGPEVASVLAVAATAMLAGQRWAIAVVVLAELLLVPTVWPRAFLSSPDMFSRVAACISLAAVVPGVLAMRRAASALVQVTGWRRTRLIHAALVVIGLVATFLPML